MKHITKYSKYKWRISFITALLFSFSSCVKEINHPILMNAEKRIVVEGILTNELKYQTIRLSTIIPQQNQKALPIQGAIINVLSSNAWIGFEESNNEAGFYISEVPFAVDIDSKLHLEMSYQNHNYIAFSGMKIVSSYNPIHFEQVENGLYHLTNPTSSFTVDEQAMYELNIIWHPTPDSTVHIQTYRYQLNTLDVSIIFSPDEENIYFPEGAMIIGKKYSLTDDYAEYIRAMLAETHWQGGLFDDEKANLPTNISNGGLGYFTACSVLVDTVIVQ